MTEIIVALNDKTTRNARKIRYFEAIYANGSSAVITLDVYGTIYKDGQVIQDIEELRYITQLVAARLAAPRPLKL